MNPISIGKDFDPWDSCDIFWQSLWITRMTVKSVGRVWGPSGDCDIYWQSLRTTRITVKVCMESLRTIR